MKNSFYILLFAILLLYNFFVPFFRIDGGFTDDMYQYIKISDSLPKLTTNVFPMGFPLTFKMFNLLFNDYYYSFRAINFVALAFIGIFSYCKKFYFKETVILLGLKTFTVFTFALSEIVFFSIFYVFIYFYYEYLVLGKSKYFVIKISFSLFLLFFFRYSGLFVTIASISFYLILVLLRKIKFTNKDFVLSFILTSIFLGGYIFFNHYYFGDFFGTQQRGGRIIKNSLVNFTFSFIINPVLSSYNPFFGLVRFNIWTLVFSSLVSLLSIGYIFYIVVKFLKNRKPDLFCLFLLTVSGVFFLLMVLSVYISSIDGLDYRLMLPSVFTLFFFVLLNSKFENKVYVLPIFSIIANIILLYPIKFNYLEKKDNLKKYFILKNQIIYYYNDINNIPSETGGVYTSNASILISSYPKIKILHEKPKFTKGVLVESELISVYPKNFTNYKNGTSSFFDLLK